MASDQQVALAVAPRGSSSHLNRPARQVVPAFLQKLYEMVNDNANHDLIRWSDTGDSFFVLDQERFASEVLGRWFKHKNFSSFVRQLNMYGFHKITHLQQGVLRSDNETEFWNFEHPNFLKGQPDLLCLIQRKKQSTQAGDDSVNTINPSNSGNAVSNLSAGQILDINSIVNGISVIKRHQTTISADLNELKTSNQHLWQEAMAARERHKKHQDTINRILKFLAGVFGHADSPIRKENANHNSPSHAVVPRKPQMLMIADGPMKRSVELNELINEDSNSNADTDMSPLRYFSSTNTPVTMESSVTPSDSSFTTASREISPHSASIEPPANDLPSPSDSFTAPQSNQLKMPEQLPQPITASAPPSSASLTSTPQNDNDTMVHHTLTQMLQSPTQMQRLLAALSQQSSYPIPDMQTPNMPQASTQLTPYDRSIGFNQEHYNDLSYPPSSLSLLSSGPDELIPFEPLLQNEESLQKTCQDAAEIDADVDALHSSIASLVESLGIPDSHSLPFVDGGTDPYTVPLEHGQGDSMVQDFDFDAFLTDLSRGEEEEADLDHLADKLDPHADASTKLNNPSPEQLHAFLDEVAQDGNSAMPGQMQSSPIAPTSQHRKRKSDIAELGTNFITGSASTNQSSPGHKAKKKK